MVKIGLLSDTHGFLDKTLFKYFDPCDEVWHAGDFGSIELANQLALYKPLRGVYGNIDEPAIRSKYPMSLCFQCEATTILMTHMGGPPKKYNKEVRAHLAEYKPQVFVCGHSHICKIVHDKRINCLYLNPGAAGKAGWQQVRTLLRFCISEKKIHTLEVIELGN